MWKCSFAAVPGLSHSREDYDTCQDVVSGMSKDKLSCICLSDGAGSAKFARLGATVVVNSTILLFEDRFSELFELEIPQLSEIIIDNCISSIRSQYGDTYDFVLSDYNATLLVVAIYDNRCICAHVGDGLIGVKKDDNFEIISLPWNGEYKNETVFVTSKEAVKVIDVKKFTLKSESGFFVMSDGTQHSFFQRGRLISLTGLNQIFKFAESNSTEDTSQFLDYNLFNLISTNITDDCSLGLIVKDSAEMV